ncbi:MAG: hypothetical protein ACE5KE_15355 [Methanosarcinales archaeon]
MKYQLGTNAWDVSGQGNNGTLTNRPTWVDYGGIDFDGSIPIYNEKYAIVVLIKPDVMGTRGMAGWGQEAAVISTYRLVGHIFVMQFSNSLF